MKLVLLISLLVVGCSSKPIKWYKKDGVWCTHKDSEEVCTKGY